MGRRKKWWRLKTFTFGGTQLDPDSRVYVVGQSFYLDREPGRVLYHTMAPEEARQRAESLLWAANRVDQLNSTAPNP